MKEEYEQTVKGYEKKYNEGYGLEYPDGHVIRFCTQVLDWELDKFKDKGNVFDYGCSIGTHLKYFSDRGWTPFGVDINAIGIEKAKKLLPEYKDNFHVIDPVPDLTKLYDVKFDVIITNQVLYYLNDEDIHNVVNQFYDMMPKGGVFFATMMSRKNYYHNYVQSISIDGLSEVVLTDRVHDTTYINFKEKVELEELFKPFKKLHIGYYDRQIIEDEGSNEHWIYIGVKE